MDDKTIIIACQGATTVELDELHELQGNLKDLSQTNYNKLKQSILENGFSFPIFMWIDEAGTKWIIDAHQRKRVLISMRNEGYIIPPLPADIILAHSRVDAKKKILLHESQYGTLTDEGFNEFINEPGQEVELANIKDQLSLPKDIHLDYNDDKQNDIFKNFTILIDCVNQEKQEEISTKLKAQGIIFRLG